MPKDPDWLTWPEALELVGCPVPTIDWYTRQGRIKKRRFKGPRPTLRRESVVEFAAWWSDRRARRQEKRERAKRRSRDRHEPPKPTGWLDTEQTGEALGVGMNHVPWLIRQGRLRAKKKAGRWWIEEASVRERRDERQQWVSAVIAAKIVGCSPQTILRAAHLGQITQRDVHRSLPSLDRDSVQEFAEAWRREQSAVADRRRAADARRLRPPDSEHTWLSSSETASALGISRSRVDQLARRDSLPFTVQGGRRWYRRDHVELVHAARVAMQQG